MSGVLFLTVRMGRGFGVDLVVDQLMRGLRARGRDAWTACLTQDGHYARDGVHEVAPDAASIRRLARALGAEVLIAHSSPFFEILPELAEEFRCVAWEHGDPTPELFEPAEALARQAVKDRKLRDVYPKVARVVAISRFVAADIGWPEASVIYNGADHIRPVPDRARPAARRPGPLRVGAIMRFGRGERRYKGVDSLIRLARELAADGVEVQALGRGEPSDVAELERAGIRVRLNASDDEKRAYLADLDVFFSGSLWEGCNLPLVEAQSMGAVGLALDTGAHPEVTPFPLANLDLALEQIRAYARDPELLRAHQEAGARFVARFRWQDTIAACDALVREIAAGGKARAACSGPSLFLRADLARARAVYAWKIYGPRLIATKLLNRAARRLRRGVAR